MRVNKAPIYGQIGLAKYNQGEYKEAITFYEKAVEIYKKDLPSNNISLATVYNNIGTWCMTTWVNIPKHFRITKNHLKFNNNHFLQIILIWLLPTTTSVMCMTDMGEYSKALSYYEKSLEIQQQSLPPNHPDLAASYMGIGIVYDKHG